MSDLDHYATKRDLASISGLGAPIYTVGPAGSSATFNTVQEGVDAAVADVEAGTYARGVVLVAPGEYLEDVLVRCDAVDIVGQGAVDGTVIRSVTITDATLASLAAFNASGLKADLVLDAALTNPPNNNSVQNVTLYRDAGVAAWTGLAQASLRFLGSEVAAGAFATNKIAAKRCIIQKADGAAAGTGNLYATYANVLEFVDAASTDGGWYFDQCSQANIFDCLSSIQTTWSYDTAGVEPAGGHVGILGLGTQFLDELQIDGDVADVTCYQCYFGSIDNNATGAGASTFYGCHCDGAIDIAALGPTMDWRGGDICVAPSGAGAAGFSMMAPVLDAPLLPSADNSQTVGSATVRFASVNATQIVARQDATDTEKNTLTGKTLTTTGSNMSISPAKAAADTAGYSESVVGGQAGDAVAAPGTAGGAAALAGGQGAAGTVALAAGAGANASLIAGAAGADGGFGGANGGDAVIRAGAATGAGTAGDVKIGLSNTTKIEVGCDVQSDTDNTDKLGTTAKAFSEVHARTIEAHGDATNTSKTTITDLSIVPTVAHFIKPTTSAVDTAGKNESVSGGNGGDASAVVGGDGGTGYLLGGAGGAGTGLLVAGAGGDVTIQAGSAGADGGGGGAQGGDVNLQGGVGSGAGRPGIIVGVSPIKFPVITLAGRAALGLGGADGGTTIFCSDSGANGQLLTWNGAAWVDGASNIVA